MIEVKKAEIRHIEGIIRVCSGGYRDTYKETHTAEYIERIIDEFYNFDRIRDEILNTGDHWNGWYVAIECETVVGAIGGGLINRDSGEVFVLYLDSKRRGEGIGTLLLNELTEIHKSKGATQQWVSVGKGNDKGIPFYEARQFVLMNEQKQYAAHENEEYISLRYFRKI